MSATDAVFYIAILIMSVVVHEISHGFMAEYFGDKTARHAGRLTINPIKHLDIFGSIILPALLIFSNAPFLFGWAKPVPFNPENLRDRKWGTFWVAFAGILANLFIAIFFGLILRFVWGTYGLALPEGLYFMLTTIVLLNLVLAIFNLLPIPPIDGSKILFSLLPSSFYKVEEWLERFGFILVIVFIVYFAHYLSPLVSWAFHLITGAWLP